MRIVIYDGAESIGGNKIYVGDGKHGLFIDFGLNFAVSNLYFKEFIKMRSIRGLNDPMEMGLLPKIDVYRDDLKPFDFSETLEKLPVDAVLLSHAHMDHYGMIGYLKHHIPVVASQETLAIIKAYQDAGKTELNTSVIYSTIRVEADDPRILKADSVKTSNVTKENKIKGKLDKLKSKYLLRPLIPTEKPSEGFLDFMCLQGDEIKTTHLKNNLYIGSLENGDLNFEIKAYPVDHSIYGSTAFVIEGKNGSIAYSGDLRLHGERGDKTEEFARGARSASILIIEGTRATNKEHEYVSEKMVKENIRGAIEDEKNLIIADFSARNFERLKIFSELARDTGRELVITEKDAYAIEGLMATGMSFDLESLRVYEKLSENIGWWQKYLGREKFNELWSDRYIGPDEIRMNPGRFILAFSLYDMPNLMDIKTYGGRYIYSSTEAFNEEMELDIKTLMNWLLKYKLQPVGFHVDDELVFEKGFHASGHAAPDDLIKIIETIDPDIIIPVHTENPQWFEENFGKEKVKILKNGETFEL